MAKPVVFVIGASGNVGKATVNALSKNYGDKLEIRAGIRNPEKAAELRSLAGVTLIQAEMGQKEKLNEIFKGVDVLFIVSPRAENRAKLSIDTAKAAKEAGVKYLLVVSIPTVQTEALLGKQFAEIETTISSLGVPSTYLRLPFFMENFFGFQESIKEDSVLNGPVDPTKPFTSIAIDDAGEAAAVILASPEKHAGKAYTIVSDRHTFGDVAQAFTRNLGREVKYVRLSYEDAKAALLQKGFPEWEAEGGMQFYRLVDEGDPAIDQANRDDFAKITGKKPTSLSTWVTKMASAFK